MVSPPFVIYMGEDKHENEELLKWAFPEDVWFHVDKLSSAHVYLRLKPGETLDDIPEAVLTDCAQLVKANSIQGSKSNNIDVVYTMFGNLKKTAGMDSGQVGFHKGKEVRKIHVEKKIGEIVNRLNKTKNEVIKPDLRGQREERDSQERAKAKEQDRLRRQAEREEQTRKEEEAERRSYSNLLKSENMTTNAEQDYDSDDFM